MLLDRPTPVLSNLVFGMGHGLGRFCRRVVDLHDLGIPEYPAPDLHSALFVLS
jgi:hypothetical protein